MNGILFSNIKLIIWDLDDTFWKGTLSEGKVTAIDSHLLMIKALTDHGIVNTICSKNDYEPAVDKLKEFGIDDYFVFKSIDWTPKGSRISQLIKNMGLRPVNCLFIDDNEMNLNEALYYEKELMTAKPIIIPELEKYISSVPPTDTECKRLKHYKILEKKQKAKAKNSNNTDFLYSSHIKVEIIRDCLPQIDRITELVNRTNQLNYTKIRCSRTELEKLCNDSTIDTGYVTVCDSFGDYGIVGFFAVQDNRCLHFLFSCRTIGQGIEQYIYAMLGYPELNVKGDVVNPVTYEKAPGWINHLDNKIENSNNPKLHTKVILKGGCDLSAMSEYLQTDSIIEEFTYTGKCRDNYQEHLNHSTNYLQWAFLSNEIKQELIEECVFNDEGMYQTAIYDEDVSIIFLSTMIEPNLGIYRRKKDGLRIAFGEYKYPLTDPKNWDLYKDQKIYTAHNQFTKEWLKWFSENYEYEGCLSPVQIAEHAKEFLKKIGTKTKVCYILGSETPFLKNSQNNYAKRHLVYQEINHLFRQLAADDDRVLLIDVNDYILGQQDFTNNINHFQRRIYYEMASKANVYIEQASGKKLRQKSKNYMRWRIIADRIGTTGFYQTTIWTLLRKPYVFIMNSFH